MNELRKTSATATVSPALSLSLILLVLGFGFIPSMAYAAEDIHDIIYYSKSIAVQGNTLYLQQNYSIIIDDVSASGDMVKLILKADKQVLKSDIYVSDTKEYTYSKTIGGKPVDIIDVNLVAFGGNMGVISVVQYADPEKSMAKKVLDKDSDSFTAGSALPLKDGYALKGSVGGIGTGDTGSASIAGADAEGAVLSLYKDDVKVRESTITIGDMFVHTKAGSVVFVARLDSVFDGMDEQRIFLTDMTQFKEPEMARDPIVVSRTYVEAEDEVHPVLAYSLHHINGFSSVDVYLDSVSFDRREDIFSGIYYVELPDTKSHGVRISAVSGDGEIMISDITLDAEHMDMSVNMSSFAGFKDMKTSKAFGYGLGMLVFVFLFAFLYVLQQSMYKGK